jgi:hypothetical protein
MSDHFSRDQRIQTPIANCGKRCNSLFGNQAIGLPSGLYTAAYIYSPLSSYPPSSTPTRPTLSLTVKLKSIPSTIMVPLGRPLVFEDKTGQYSTTDLDDIYDRMFFRVVQHSVSPTQTIILVYDRARRSNRRNSGPETIPPSVVLDFTPKSNSLGSVTFERMPPIPIKEFLRKVGTFGRFVV